MLSLVDRWRRTLEHRRKLLKHKFTCTMALADWKTAVNTSQDSEVQPQPWPPDFSKLFVDAVVDATRCRPEDVRPTTRCIRPRSTGSRCFFDPNCRHSTGTGATASGDTSGGRPADRVRVGGRKPTVEELERLDKVLGWSLGTDVPVWGAADYALGETHWIAEEYALDCRLIQHRIAEGDALDC